MITPITIFPVQQFPIVKTQAGMWQSIDSLVVPQTQNGDVLVFAHTPWSRVKGPMFAAKDITPSTEAHRLAALLDKPPEKMEVILQLSDEVIKAERNILITRNKAGIVCANGGVDESNAGLNHFVGVPADPDALAAEIRTYFKEKHKLDVVIIISDTVGRALRRGAVNIAVGVAGIPAMRSDIGKFDLFGYQLRVSEVAIADELASAAELFMGQSNEGVPCVVIRGIDLSFSGRYTGRELNRPAEERLFK